MLSFFGQRNICGRYHLVTFPLQAPATLIDLPAVVLREILKELPVHDQFSMLQVHPIFAQLLQDKSFWSNLHLISDKVFTNDVCRYVCVQGSKVLRLLVDNVSSSDSDFVMSWMDVLMSSFPNVHRVVVERATFLTSGLFITRMPQIVELQLSSCPNLCSFSLMQGFMCAQPSALSVLSLTGVPGLDEHAVVRIASSCKALKNFDISGVWGPYMCVNCVQKIIRSCPHLMWLDFCPHRLKRQGWMTLLSQHGLCAGRVVRFGLFVSTAVGVDDDSD